MAARRKVGNMLALAVLAYLTQRPMHPYELSRTLRDNDDARSIKFSHGSLYMVVGQLARAGLIAEQETSREGQRPERTVYAITDSGRTEFREWLTELLAEPQYEYPHFVAALSLVAALPPDEVVRLLGDRLARLAAQQAETQSVIDGALAAGLHPLFPDRRAIPARDARCRNGVRDRFHRADHEFRNGLGTPLGRVPPPGRSRRRPA